MKRDSGLDAPYATRENSLVKSFILLSKVLFGELAMSGAFFWKLFCELLLFARYLSIFKVLFKSPLKGLSAT